MDFYSPNVARRIRRENRGSKPKPPIVKPAAPELRAAKTFDPSAWTWWAARVATGQGVAFQVVDELSAAGYEGFAPAGRSTYVWRGRKMLREYPVYGAYVLVGAKPDTRLYKRSHVKIEQVLGDAEGPIPIPQSAIRIISELDRAGAWGSDQTEVGVMPAFMQGDRVRALQGAFVGLQGVIQYFPKEMRAVVEMSMLGHLTKVNLDLGDLEMAC